MDNNIEKLYKLIYSPIVTPYNLIENSKLDNYEYVKYYKSLDGLICEMKCITEDGIEAVFYYNFDDEDKLYKVYMETTDEKKIVFNREEEIEKIRKQYSMNRDNIFSKCI